MADKTRKASAEDYQHYLKHGHFPNEPKPSKYGNTKAIWGGMTFDSRWELERYLELVAMDEAGQITELKRQVEFVLQPAFMACAGEHVRAIKYIADFTYLEWRVIDGITSGELVVEDAKGFETDVFRLKWKLIQYLHRDKPTRFFLSRKGEKDHG